MYDLLTIDEIDKFEEFVNREENPVIYLAIDPGGKNGVCGYDVKAYLSFMVTVKADDMIYFLEKFHNIKKCIIEDFTLYPDKAREQIYSDMETSRVIGRVEAWSERKKIQLIKQPAKIKPTGYKWIGKKPLSKKNPQNHSMDANVHFIYWAVRNNLIKASDLLRDTKVRIDKGDF